MKVDLAVWYSFNCITSRASLLNKVSNASTKDILSEENTKHIKSAKNNILDCAQQRWKQKAKRRLNHVILTKLPGFGLSVEPESAHVLMKRKWIKVPV